MGFYSSTSLQELIAHSGKGSKCNCPPCCIAVSNWARPRPPAQASAERQAMRQSCQSREPSSRAHTHARCGRSEWMSELQCYNHACVAAAARGRAGVWPPAPSTPHVMQALAAVGLGVVLGRSTRMHARAATWQAACSCDAMWEEMLPHQAQRMRQSPKGAQAYDQGVDSCVV